MKERVELDKTDFDFIDDFCNELDIQEGKGHKAIFARFLNQYKIKTLQEAKGLLENGEIKDES